MIKSVSDFALVDVDPFKGFLDEFESYPARANAAGGMPYDSLSDLKGKLDPPLKCLDPAWLTELVREVEWFRRYGFHSVVHPSAVRLAGAKQPPVVLKDFLEEARRTVRGWAEEWESDDCPRGVVIEEGLSTTWTSLGAITMSWDADDGAYELPPGADDYELLHGEDDELTGSELDPAGEYRRALAEKARRDFLSIWLFDREMPEDDPSVPEFSWKETDDKLGEADDQLKEGDQKGVSAKYLSRQLLALHSDCEKASLLLVPMGGIPDVEPSTFEVHYWAVGQREKNGRYKTHDDCFDGCGTVHTGEGSVTPLDSDRDESYQIKTLSSSLCPPEHIPVSVSRPSSFHVRYSIKRKRDWIYYPIDECHNDKCEFMTHSVREFWSDRENYESGEEWDVPSPTLSWSCNVPDFVEVKEAWVVLVALSRKLASDYSEERRLTNPSDGTTEPVYSSKGTYDAQLFFALVPAEYSGGTLTVSSIPDVPQPSGGVQVKPKGYPPEPGSTVTGTMCERYRYHLTLDAAEIVGVLGAVAKVKFRASVKEG